MKDNRTKSASDQNIPTILYECRELMICHLKQSLPNMMDAVDDVLLDIAVKTTNSLERKRYFSAMHEVRLKKNDIERECIENFVALFGENLRSDNRVKNEFEDSKDMNSMSMTATVNKIRNNCQQALLSLDKRMNMMQKSGVNKARKNPFSPEVICRAFYNACEQLGSGTEIRLIIFKCFEKSVASLLNGVYSEIDNAIKSGGLIRKSGPGNQNISVGDDGSESHARIADTKRAVESEVQDILKDKHVPAFVSDFLLKHWVILLVKIHDKSGTNSDSWLHAIDTVKDLVWSVGSISSKEDRDRFNKLWPDLIKRLRNGINMISMSPREETDFISSLSKHRATLTRLGALSKLKSNDVTLIGSDKIKALKDKINSGIGKAIAKELGLDNTGSENTTQPSLKMHGHQRPFMDELLVDNYAKGENLDSTGSKNTTLPSLKIVVSKRPFMDELLVDNHKTKGFKRDTDKN